MKTITNQINFRCDDKLLAELDYYAHKVGLNRAQLMRNLIRIGLDDMKLLNSVGLLVVGRGVRDLIEKVRSGEIKGREQGQLEL